MRVRDWRWGIVYGMMIVVCVVGVWRLLTPWRYAPDFLLRFLAASILGLFVGFAMHEGLHLWAALAQGVDARQVEVGLFRFWMLEPVSVAVYRRIVLLPLVLPLLAGILVAAATAEIRLGLAAALLWLLGSTDDLADWVRLAGKKGWAVNRPGEGLRLEYK